MGPITSRFGSPAPEFVGLRRGRPELLRRVAGLRRGRRSYSSRRGRRAEQRDQLPDRPGSRWLAYSGPELRRRSHLGHLSGHRRSLPPLAYGWLEYDFEVAPGVDPDPTGSRSRARSRSGWGPEGDLLVSTRGGEAPSACATDLHARRCGARSNCGPLRGGRNRRGPPCSFATASRRRALDRSRHRLLHVSRGIQWERRDQCRGCRDAVCAAAPTSRAARTRRISR